MQTRLQRASGTVLILGGLLALGACDNRFDRRQLPQPTASQPCPQWTLFPADRHSNADSPYLGCSTELNLRAMVENPADLQRGRPLGPANGERQAAAVAAYEAGKGKAAQGAAGMAPSLLIPTASGSSGGQ